jgi:hypothetical protein
LLPYSMQLVGLAAFFGNLKTTVTDGQRRLLSRWLWVSAFTEGFGGLNPSRILLQLKDLRETIPGQVNPDSVHGIDLDAPAHPFPERHDLRSARVRALLCVMLQAPICDQNGVKINPREMGARILARGPEAMTRICLKIEKNSNPRLLASPANRIFDIGQTKQVYAKNWIIGLDRVADASVLSSQFISDEARTALENSHHTEFIEKRMHTLMELERDFMKQKGVVEPKSDRAAPNAIDVEDVVPLSDEG